MSYTHAHAARRPPNYDHMLTRPILLADGRTLITLQDAVNVLAETFVVVNTRTRALDHAMRAVIAAGASGNPQDIEAATNTIEVVLRSRQLL